MDRPAVAAGARAAIGRPRLRFILAIGFAVAPYVATVMFGGAFALVWELASGRVISELWVSRPTEIWAAFVDLVQEGELQRHLPITVKEAAYGFVIGVVWGSGVGVLLGRNEFLSKALNPFVIAFYTTPRLALAPLFIIWFGIGLQMKVAVVSTVVFLPVFMVVFTGAREVSEELLGIARIMGAGRIYLFFRIVLPSVLVWLFVGLKQAIPFALVSAVVAELIASNRGMGFLIIRAGSSFNTAELFAALFVLIGLGYASYEVLRILESRLLRWRRSGEMSGGMF